MIPMKLFPPAACAALGKAQWISVGAARQSPAESISGELASTIGRFIRSHAMQREKEKIWIMKALDTPKHRSGLCPGTASNTLCEWIQDQCL